MGGLFGRDCILCIADHQGLRDDAVDGVQDPAGATDVERRGKHYDMTERGADGGRRAYERIGDAGLGGENSGVPVLIGIVFDADYGDFGVVGLQALQPGYFRAARAAPRGPEVYEDGFALGRLRGERRAVEVLEGEAAHLNVAGRRIVGGAEIEPRGEDEKNDGRKPPEPEFAGGGLGWLE